MTLKVTLLLPRRTYSFCFKSTVVKGDIVYHFFITSKRSTVVKQKMGCAHDHERKDSGM